MCHVEAIFWACRGQDVHLRVEGRLWYMCTLYVVDLMKNEDQCEGNFEKNSSGKIELVSWFCYFFLFLLASSAQVTVSKRQFVEQILKHS